MPFAPALAPSSLPAPLLAGLALHMARGFGAKKKPPEDAGSELRAVRKLRGKIVPCTTCKGSGKKPCQFCDGTTLMRGFLGELVPCVPCQGKATLGRPCVDCNGLGYFTP